ncbi:MAG: glycosyltransferase [Bacteroidales bacterium]|nr:glycosyltransferase [Bacteroidales bacterium]
MSLIILSSVLLFFLLVQAVFYILPEVGVRKKIAVEVSDADLPPVSVVIACRNEQKTLKSNLQYIVNQQYPEFEIVIVDDNSTDGTREYISELVANMSSCNIKLVKNDGQGKKSALSCGIRAAAYERLIFTDADCRPATEKWISGMMTCFDEPNPLVVGYGELSGKTFAARFASYDAALIAMQYMGFSSLGRAYMGVGRNIAYSRKLWDTLGGFDSHSDLASGDDDLLVREAAKHIRPTVCFSHEAKTISPAKDSIGKLLRQKSRHISTSVRYSFWDKFLSGGEILSRTLFFAVAVAMLFVNWKIALVFFVVRLVMAMTSHVWFCRATKTDFNLFMSLIFDIFAPIFYFALLVYRIFNRKTEW